MNIPNNPESGFTRSVWLVMILSAGLILYAILTLAYLLTLPTDGWIVNDASAQPGVNYVENLMGSNTALQVGDRVVAAQGIPLETAADSRELNGAWHVGATIDYTVIRAEQELHIPVTLINWQTGKWLLSILLDPLELVNLLSQFFLLGLAVFILFRQPRNPTAGAFLLLMAMFTATSLGDLTPGGVGFFVDPLADLLYYEINLAFTVVLLPFALLQFALVFPHPKPIYKRHPWLSYAAGAAGLVLLIASTEIPLAWFWLLFSIFLTVGILVHNAFTMRDAVSQAQLRWGLSGLIFNFGLLGLALAGSTFGLYRPSPQDFNIYFSLISLIGGTVMGITLAVAILRYRLFDIDVIIRKTLLYALLTGLLSLVYFGGVTLLQAALEVVGGQTSPVIIVLTTLVIAALFNPLRNRLQDFIDRRFYRKKYDAEKVLGEFALAAHSETDLEQLAEHLTGAVQETLQPEQVTLWLLPHHPDHHSGL